MRRASASSEGTGRSTATSAGPAVPDEALDSFFEAVVDATEESVLNTVWATNDVVGREGRLVRPLPHDDILALLDAHGRLR